MDSVLFRATLATSLVALATTATADEFDYEIRVGYAATDTTQELGLFNTIPPSGGVLVIDSDSDTLAVSGSWFYDGLSDANGPRTRAQFLDRASALTASLSFGEGDSTSVEVRPGDPLFQPQLVSTADFSNDEFGVAVRHVWRDPGFFVHGSINRLEIETQGTSLFAAPIPASTSSFDTASTTYSFGVGYYFAKNTAASLTYTRSDADVDFGAAIDADTWTLGVTHVAALSTDWH
ncbi:MAG: outer membrane beta-barrel protein [Pseudomonadota bacterium]